MSCLRPDERQLYLDSSPVFSFSVRECMAQSMVLLSRCTEDKWDAESVRSFFDLRNHCVDEDVSCMTAFKAYSFS